MDFQNKIIVVTGAASGIGLALATRFVREGATVIASDLNADTGAQKAAEIGARFVAANVAKEEEIGALVADVLAREGRIDAGEEARQEVARDGDAGGLRRLYFRAGHKRDLTPCRG